MGQESEDRINDSVNPGFEPVPWKARTEMEKNVGKYTPRHLHYFTPEEQVPKNYPRATRDADGNITCFCWACGRPTKENGVSGKRWAGVGKPCPGCGFRRRRSMSEKAIQKGRENLALARKTDVNNARNPEHLQKMLAAKKKVPKVTEIMLQKAEEKAEKILAPYFEGLELAPREDWSPGTKLEFYLNQTQIAEKLMNRVEGMPVARTRHVDKDDDDVFNDNDLSNGVMAQLVAAIATGADISALLGTTEVIEDAEYTEEKD